MTHTRILVSNGAALEKAIKNLEGITDKIEIPKALQNLQAEMKKANPATSWKDLLQAQDDIYTRAIHYTLPNLITIYLADDILDIIKRQGNKSKHPNDYIFPIMRQNLTALEQFDLVNFVRKIINQGMAEIRKALGIEKSITTIVSRHTFSTQLKRSGVSNEYIQEVLGHTDKRTTENYLDSFEKELKKEFASKLVEFKYKL